MSSSTAYSRSFHRRCVSVYTHSCTLAFILQSPSSHNVMRVDEAFFCTLFPAYQPVHVRISQGSLPKYGAGICSESKFLPRAPHPGWRRPRVPSAPSTTSFASGLVRSLPAHRPEIGLSFFLALDLWEGRALFPSAGGSVASGCQCVYLPRYSIYTSSDWHTRGERDRRC